MQVVLQSQLGEWRALDVRDADRIQRDVDAAGLGRDGVGVLGHRFFIERIDLRHVSGNFTGDLVERGAGATGEENPGALTGECARHRAAYRACAAVDDRRLAFKQHSVSRDPSCAPPDR
jgi:hypothetical protein